MAYIETENLSKSIHSNILLQDITLSLEEGNVYGFVGRNGSGKTMLFRALCGLIKPTQGRITINGKQLGKDISFPDSIGLLLENIGLWEWLSGFDNLKLLSKTNKSITNEEIKRVISDVGLDPTDRRPVRKYSLGMKQRIALAQAFMGDPELLILDEPTNALDEAGVREIRSLIAKKKKSGATILLASHNKGDIGTLCDTIFYMDGGRITRREAVTK